MTLGEAELKRRFEVFKAKAGTLRTYVLACETACIVCRQSFRATLLLAVGEGAEAPMAAPLDEFCPHCRDAADARQRRRR